MSSTKSAEDIIREIEVLAAELPAKVADNESLRLRAQMALHAVAHICDTPYDIFWSQMWEALNPSLAMVGIDLNIFTTLVAAGADPVTFSTIVAAAPPGADPQLIRRILVYLNAHGMIGQVDADNWIANALTPQYTLRGRIGNVQQFAEVSQHAWAALPEQMRRTGFKNPADQSNTAFNLGHATPLPFFGWLTERPDQLEHFNQFMAAPRMAADKVLAMNFPSEAIFAGSTAEDVIFVDVGGGNGQQCVNLRTTFPKERGRVVLQDLPEVVAGKELPDVEVMAHDMFTPQPVIGARAYYMRGITHDHPDNRVVLLLQQTAAAMRPYSRLLIHEMVVPEVGASKRISELDMVLMSQFAAMERTPRQFQALTEAAGLEIIAHHNYGDPDWRITEVKLRGT